MRGAGRAGAGASVAAAAASSASRARVLASRNDAGVSGSPTLACVRHSSAVASGVPRNRRSGIAVLRGPFGRGLDDPLAGAEIVTVLVDPRAETGPGPDERLVHELHAALVDGEEAAGRQRVDDGAASRRRRSRPTTAGVSCRVRPRRASRAAGTAGAPSMRSGSSRRSYASSADCAIAPTTPPAARNPSTVKTVPRRRRHVSISAWEMSGRPPGSSPASSRIASVRPGSSRMPGALRRTLDRAPQLGAAASGRRGPGCR